MTQTEDKLRYETDDLTGCWNWLGGMTGRGYGAVWVNGKQRQAHRVSYEHFVGPIPEGLQLDHLCRNRGCINPEHLEPVTQAENLRRGISPSALNAQKTHCLNGHEFTPENTYSPPKRPGVRYCRVCVKDRYARWSAK